MMNVVSTVGFSGTGSSAVTDLLNEYVNVKKNTDYEIAWLYDYKGIDYLCHALVESPDYHTSNTAINEFWKHCNYLAKNGTKMNYEIYFHNKFLQCTKDYIEDIGGENMPVVQMSELESKSKLLQLSMRALTKFYHLFHDDFKPILGLKKKPFYFHELDENVFVEKTKLYIRNLFSCFEEEGKDTVVIDQLCPNSNIDRYVRFFDDIKVIVVDRDPRDVYLNNKYRWKDGYNTDSIETFCKWYEWLRKIPCEADGKYLHIQFENMIYKYEETIQEIEQYCNLKAENHINKMQYFIPEKSIGNCRLWEKYKNEETNIKYIEKHLERYLYNE